jgi:hypothetical protein
MRASQPGIGAQHEQVEADRGDPGCGIYSKSRFWGTWLLHGLICSERVRVEVSDREIYLLLKEIQHPRIDSSLGGAIIGG